MGRSQERGGQCISQYFFLPHFQINAEPSRLVCSWRRGEGVLRPALGLSCLPHPGQWLLQAISFWGYTPAVSLAGNRPRGLSQEQSGVDFHVNCEPGHQESDSLTNLVFNLGSGSGVAASPS
jgi:hypothetical protein